MNRAQQQSGWYTIFFTLFVLPLLFILGTLALDVSQYFYARQRLQQVTDSAAIQASRYLPNQQRAQEFITSYLAENISAKIRKQISTENDLMSLQTEYDYNFKLASLAGIKNFGIPVRAIAVATSAPRDLMLFLDVSSYLAPTAANNLWGDQLQWPAANFYQNLYPVVGNNGVPINPRYLTQKCQNPIFTEIKRAAINFYKYFSEYQSLQIGIGYFPGSFSALSAARPALLHGEKLSGQQRYLQREEHSFLGWSNTLCGAMAEEEVNLPNYRFPLRSSESGRPARMTVPKSWLFNQDYENYLIPEEYLWMLAAEEQRVADFSQLLVEARAYISGSKFLASRGNLASQVRRTAIFITPSLPRVNGLIFPDNNVTQALASQFANYRQDIMTYGLQISLFLVIYNPDLSPIVNNAASLAAFRNFLNAQELENNQKLKGFKLRLLEVKNSEQLNEKIQGLIGLEAERALLRR